MPEKLIQRDRPYHYTQSGLANVWLVRIYEDSDGDPVIPNVDRLHEMLAQQIATQKQRLIGREVRFLRTHTGYSSVDFAKKVARVEPETVSRWENDSQRMSIHTELALRMMVLHRLRYADYDLGDLAITTSLERSRLEVVQLGKVWKLVA